MSLIRYQAPDLASWMAADRWSNLRDELHSLLESPFWSGFGRGGQLFTGWSPALDLYQSNDNIVAVIAIPARSPASKPANSAFGRESWLDRLKRQIYWARD